MRLALKIFCPRIRVQNRHLLKKRGPLLITANHPNSFLDAIIIGSVFDEPVHFLSRGDAFKKRWHNQLLRKLNMIPVYRLSEGKENLYLNEAAFIRSKEILTDNGIVLIFIEGISRHQHTLQPFKKGAARIAMEGETLDNFCIMPLGIAYRSFDNFGKLINLVPVQPIPIKELLPFGEATKNIRFFNEKIYEAIEANIRVPTTNPTSGKYKKMIIFLPGLVGMLLHLPLYSALKSYIRKKTRETVFYDSVLFGSLLLLYPLYLMLLAGCFLLMNLATGWIALLLIIHPVSAYFAAQLHTEMSATAEDKESGAVTFLS